MLTKTFFILVDFLNELHIISTDLYELLNEKNFMIFVAFDDFWSYEARVFNAILRFVDFKSSWTFGFLEFSSRLALHFFAQQQAPMESNI